MSHVRLARLARLPRHARIADVAVALALVITSTSCAPPPPPLRDHAGADVLDEAFDDDARVHDDDDSVRVRARGRAIFAHNWIENDPWSAGGDGLGPYFNASSCVACHAQGGVGGAGASHTNARRFARHDVRRPARGFDTTAPLVAVPIADEQRAGDTVASLRARREAPPRFQLLRDESAAALAERNTPALFGAGLLDRVSDDAILALADRSHADHPEIHGRVSRTADGVIGRFGWKAEVPRLADFVAGACAAEIGLEVPGQPQRARTGIAERRDLTLLGVPVMPRSTRKGAQLDLTLDDLEALTSFVAALPHPVEAEHPAAHDGRAIFESIGCAACHAPALDDVDGVYSDLLLHDMGEDLTSVPVAYYGLGAPPPDTARLWRTPPLWGVRDSGPWLHDGRAVTLDDAIAMHSLHGQGEARRVIAAWRKLSTSERQALTAFLESLVAPGLS